MSDGSLKSISRQEGRVRVYRVRWVDKHGRNPSRTFPAGQKGAANRFLSEVRLATTTGVVIGRPVSIEYGIDRHWRPAYEQQSASHVGSMRNVEKNWLPDWVADTLLDELERPETLAPISQVI